MKAGNKYYIPQASLSYDEIRAYEVKGRAMRNEVVAGLAASMFSKLSALFKKGLHIDVNRKYSNHGRAPIS